MATSSAEPSSAAAEADAVVVGIGQLGLCFALTLERAGYSVVGVDARENYIRSLQSRTYQTKEPGVTEMLRTAHRFEATTDLAGAVARTGLIFVLVPTPTSGNSERFYDHSALSGVLCSLNQLKIRYRSSLTPHPETRLCALNQLKIRYHSSLTPHPETRLRHDRAVSGRNKHVVINATVMPGYCRNVATLLLKDCAAVSVSYNPAFVAQGDILDGYLTGGWFGMVLIGAGSKTAGELLEGVTIRIRDIVREAPERDGGPRGTRSPRHPRRDVGVYRRIAGEARVCVMSAESAEICKLASNCFRTTKISFANMVGPLPALPLPLPLSLPPSLQVSHPRRHSSRPL